MQRLSIAVLLASIGIPFGVATMPAQDSQAKGQVFPQDQGFVTIRDVAQTEINVFASGRQEFVGLSDVVRSPEWTDRRSMTRRDLDIQVKTVDATSATILDYTLRVTRSDDKRHFEASLTPTNRGCGTAWFIDERLLVWVGKPLDCR